MIKNKITLVMFGLAIIIHSCNKTDLDINNLIGLWQSFKVDTLIHYIIPQKDSVFQSGDFQNNRLEINTDGSFKMIQLKDTIYGEWIQYNNDSLRLTNNNPHGEYIYDSKIGFIDKNNLTVSYTYGSMTVSFNELDDSNRVIENTINDIKIYYKRK